MGTFLSGAFELGFLVIIHEIHELCPGMHAVTKIAKFCKNRKRSFNEGQGVRSTKLRILRNVKFQRGGGSKSQEIPEGMGGKIQNLRPDCGKSIDFLHMLVGTT